jgi:hypothetical protein
VERSGRGPIYHVKPDEEQQIRNRYIPNINEDRYSCTQTPVCWTIKLLYLKKSFTAQYSEHWIYIFFMSPKMLQSVRRHSAIVSTVTINL